MFTQNTSKIGHHAGLVALILSTRQPSVKHFSRPLGSCCPTGYYFSMKTKLKPPAPLSPQVIGERLRAAIELKGISQRELCRQTGITPAMLSRYVKGHRLPDLPPLGKLLKALGLKYGDLLDE